MRSFSKSSKSFDFDDFEKHEETWNITRQVGKIEICHNVPDDVDGQKGKYEICHNTSMMWFD